MWGQVIPYENQFRGTILGQAPGGEPNLGLIVGANILQTGVEGATSQLTASPEATKATEAWLKAKGFTGVSPQQAQAGLNDIGSLAVKLAEDTSNDPAEKIKLVAKGTTNMTALALTPLLGPFGAQITSQFISQFAVALTNAVNCSAKGYDFCEDGTGGIVPLLTSKIQDVYVAEYGSYLDPQWATPEALAALMAPMTEAEIKAYGLKGVSPAPYPLNKGLILARVKDPKFAPDNIGAITRETRKRLTRQAILTAFLQLINTSNSMKQLDPKLFQADAGFQSLTTDQKRSVYEAIRNRRKVVNRDRLILTLGIAAGLSLIISPFLKELGKKHKG
jgi:hypothetical protein